jgi:HSP20 family protein
MFELMRTITTGNGTRLPALGFVAGVSPQLAPADVVETKDAIVVRLDLPGHKTEDIQLKVENDVLTIEAQRKARESNGETYHRSERTAGKTFRSFSLPANVDGARTEAAYVDGVLEITLPKREEAKPRSIPVKTR